MIGRERAIVGMYGAGGAGGAHGGGRPMGLGERITRLERRVPGDRVHAVVVVDERDGEGDGAASVTIVGTGERLTLDAYRRRYPPERVLSERWYRFVYSEP